jgi:glycosyltransferase involved in cell wall biosynthesis
MNKMGVRDRVSAPRPLIPIRAVTARSADSRPLTILHVATINKPIAADIGYGPIETVIYNLDKGLHELGHRSIVACSADSVVTGEKFATVSRSLGDYWRSADAAGRAHIDTHLSRALARAQAGDIDVIHMHEWFERVYDGSFQPSAPIVMTLHVPGRNSGVAEFRQWNPGMPAYPDVHFTAISEHQRRQYAGLLPVTRTISHGIDVDDYHFQETSNRGSYLFSIGRITSVKGQDLAIEVAKRAGAKLILAGCVQNKEADHEFFARLQPSIDLSADLSGDIGRYSVDSDYYERVMKPILSSGKQCIYVGELDAAAKKHWYRHAQATLFPIRWGEPFGMVLIESMASGTPIVAFREGAVPEIVRHGDTGFLVDSVEAMVEAVGRIEQIDRAACRRHVKTRFSIENMAAAYSTLYRQLADKRARPARTVRSAMTVAPRPEVAAPIR